MTPLQETHFLSKPQRRIVLGDECHSLAGVSFFVHLLLPTYPVQLKYYETSFLLCLKFLEKRRSETGVLIGGQSTTTVRDPGNVTTWEMMI